MNLTAINCSEGFTVATITAWRDGALLAADTARVETHVEGCVACRANISEIERLDTTLWRLPAREPDERLWRTVRERVRSSHPARGSRRSSRRLTGGFAAIAAVLLLSLGFAQLLRDRGTLTTLATPSVTATMVSTPSPLATAFPAASAVNGPRPPWVQATLPIRSLTDQDILTFGVVPENGNSAYACYGSWDLSGTSRTFFRTTDRSMHWVTLTHIKAPSLDLTECAVQVDALDENRVLIEIRGQDTQNSNDVISYEFTQDSGATWTKFDASSMFYNQATFDGATYAMQYQQNSLGTGTLHLSVSTDDMKSQQLIDQALVGANQGVANFWINPDGELLAEVWTMSGLAAAPSPVATASTSQPAGVALWRSSDGGAHWEALSMPVLSSAATEQNVIVHQPTMGEVWHVCVLYSGHGGVAPAGLACTFDGGHTWSVRPLVCTIAPCAPTGQSILTYTIASDDAVLDIALAPGSESQLALYRLPQASATWQYLGPITGSNAFFFAPASSGGIIQAYTGGEFLGRLSGIIGGHQSLPGVLATATYL